MLSWWLYRGNTKLGTNKGFSNEILLWISSFSSGSELYSHTCKHALNTCCDLIIINSHSDSEGAEPTDAQLVSAAIWQWSHDKALLWPKTPSVCSSYSQVAERVPLLHCYRPHCSCQRAKNWKPVKAFWPESFQSQRHILPLVKKKLE